MIELHAEDNSPLVFNFTIYTSSLSPSLARASKKSESHTLCVEIVTPGNTTLYIARGIVLGFFLSKTERY
jgi:hypothetical protein